MVSTQPQVLIYCDVDGVLHQWPCTSDEMFDEGCITRLEKAIRSYDAGLVITSNWRLEWPLALLKQKMGALREYVVGITPEIEDPFLKFTRYHEVLQYHQQNGIPGSRWIAIDDEAGHYPSTLNNLVLCDPRVGLDDTTANDLTRLLNGMP